MGFYIVCKVCGRCEKYRHPDCGHDKQEQADIQQRMIGATILSVSEPEAPFNGLILQLVKNGVTFSVEYVAPDDYVVPGLRTIDEEDARDADDLNDMLEADATHERNVDLVDSDLDDAPDEESYKRDADRWKEMLDYLNSPAPERQV